MKTIYYTNKKTGATKSARLGFSFAYFVFFPVRYLLSGRIFKFLFQIIFYLLLLTLILPAVLPFLSVISDFYNPLLVKLQDLIINLPTVGPIVAPYINGYVDWTKITVFGDIKLGHILGALILVLTHLYISFTYNKKYNNYLISKGYVPDTDQELDYLYSNKVISKGKYRKLKKQRQIRSYEDTNTTPTLKAKDVYQEYQLSQLAELYKKGMISKEDYDNRYKQILSK